MLQINLVVQVFLFTPWNGGSLSLLVLDRVFVTSLR